MHALEAKSKIIDYLLIEEKDSIKFDDFNKFISTSTDNNEGITACLCALQTLTNEGYLYLNPLSNAQDTKTLCWILTAPIGSKDQTIKLDGSLCFDIANIVNSMSDETDNDMICDPTNLTSQDVEMCVNLVHMLASQNAENCQEDEEEPIPNKDKKK